MPCPSRFTLGKETWYPLYIRLGEPQGWSGQVQKIVPPPEFFLFSCTLYFICSCFFVLNILHFAFLSLLTTHNTNIHAPGRIQTCNPSKRSATDPHFRQRGHWGFNHQTIQPVASRYTDWAILTTTTTIMIMITIIKYKDVTTEIQCMWNVKRKVIPVIIGATWTISKSFRNYLSNIPGKHEIKELQKTAILGTAHILWKALM
jgi:hypothetical protein